MIAAASIVWGSVPTWALFALGIFAAWRLSRGGAGSAVSELSKANEVLTNRNHDLGAEIRDAKIEVAALKERTDITLALEPAVSRIIERLSEHESRAIERHEAVLRESSKQLTVLSMIADRLGSDSGSVTA